MGFDMENVLQAIRRREQGVFKQLFESYFKKMTLFAEYFCWIVVRLRILFRRYL